MLKISYHQLITLEWFFFYEIIFIAESHETNQLDEEIKMILIY